jgi:hypothetical protein
MHSSFHRNDQKLQKVQFTPRKGQSSHELEEFSEIQQLQEEDR